MLHKRIAVGSSSLHIAHLIFNFLNYGLFIVFRFFGSVGQSACHTATLASSTIELVVLNKIARS